MHKVSQAAMMVIGGAACAGPGGMIMRTSIRTTAMLAVLVLGWSSISAGTPEEAYIEARDAAIAKIKAAVVAETRLPTAAYGDRILTTEKQARADLEQQMRTIIGPVSIDGLDRTGALNLDTLIEGDQGFGALDGMIYGPVDAKTRAIERPRVCFDAGSVSTRTGGAKTSRSFHKNPVRPSSRMAFIRRRS